MFELNRYFFLFIAAALIGVAHAFSLLWYLNAPIYDFVEKNLGGVKPAQVLLIDSQTRLNRSDEKTIVAKLADSGVETTVLLRDWEYDFDKGSSSLDANIESTSSPRYVNALPISARQADLINESSINRPPNTILLLEPFTGNDGIVRFFDARNYQRLGLDCAECSLVRNGSTNLDDDFRPFLINYLNHKAMLPRVSAEQVLNDSVPDELFAGKLVIFDLSVASIKEVYRTNLFSSQKVSFAYYTASVLNSALTEQKNVVLPLYGVLISLFLVGIALSVLLRDISLNSALIIVTLTMVSLVSLNVVTLRLFNTFVPIFEHLIFISLFLLYAIKARNALVIKDLQASNGVLELTLAEANSYVGVHDTTLCSDLHRFFSRAGYIHGLSVYLVSEVKQTECVLTFDQNEQDDASLNEIVTAIDRLSSHSERCNFVDENGHPQSYLLIPISTAKNTVACIAISIDDTPEADVNKIISLSEKYQDELNSEIVSWLKSKSDASKLINPSSSPKSWRRRTLTHRNRHYVRELIECYKQAKNNYNRLDSSVAIYDVYGNLMSVNASAEVFAKQNDTVWYGAPLNVLLTQVSGLDSQKTQKIINRVLMQNSAHRFTLKESIKDHIGVLSHRHILDQQGNEKDLVRSFLSLEIINISNIGASARLKDSYVRDLTNQIKQDLSKLTLLVDRLSIMDEDSEKYQRLSNLIEKLNDRVRKSKEFIVDLPSIEGASLYSVNLLEKLDETLRHFEQVLEDKNIKLVYNKQSFLSPIVLDYRELEFVFGYLFELLLDDSIVNSVLEVSIQEKIIKTSRSISIVVKNTGYGVPQEILESEIESNKNHPLKRCQEFARVHGGRLELSTTVGEGIEFSLKLPVESQRH